MLENVKAPAPVFTNVNPDKSTIAALLIVLVDALEQLNVQVPMNVLYPAVPPDATRLKGVAAVQVIVAPFRFITEIIDRAGCICVNEKVFPFRSTFPAIGLKVEVEVTLSANTTFPDGPVITKMKKDIVLPADVNVDVPLQGPILSVNVAEKVIPEDVVKLPLTNLCPAAPASVIAFDLAEKSKLFMAKTRSTVTVADVFNPALSKITVSPRMG